MRAIIIAIAILLSGCATLESKNTAVACQAADVVTTKIAITSGAGVESNPLMKGLMSHGWLPFIAFKAGFAWILQRDEVPKEGRVAANAITCGVAASNLLFLR